MQPTRDLAGPAERVEVLIAGDGVMALVAALALRAALGPQARIAMAADAPARVSPDGRAYAIAASGRELLDGLGVWQALAGEAQPIDDIVITDSRLDEVVRPSLLCFAQESDRDDPLAHMVEAEALNSALAKAAQGAQISRFGHRLTDIAVAGGFVEARLGAGGQVEASLLVAADGARSLCREIARIAWIGWTYAQLGLTATIAHERPHEARAYEHFLLGGPFAVLPLKGNRSSIVWAEEAREAKRLVAAGPDRLQQEIVRRVGRELGDLRLEGALASFPLKFGVARSFVGQRLALIGDAAHLIHPVAGQGLNLGLRDVAALADAVSGAARLGLDPGAPHALEAYQRARRFDTAAMGAVTDGLVKLFSNDLMPLRALRDLGLGAVDRLPLVKRFLTRQAAGRAWRDEP